MAETDLPLFQDLQSILVEPLLINKNIFNRHVNAAQQILLFLAREGFPSDDVETYPLSKNQNSAIKSCALEDAIRVFGAGKKSNFLLRIFTEFVEPHTNNPLYDDFDVELAYVSDTELTITMDQVRVYQGGDEGNFIETNEMAVRDIRKVIKDELLRKINKFFV